MFSESSWRRFIRLAFLKLAAVVSFGCLNEMALFDAAVGDNGVFSISPSLKLMNV